MSESLFSESWYRVKHLKPELRGHAQIHRHSYRGQDWYVLQDHTSGRYHRFSPQAYQIIGLMDGRHTLDHLWLNACERLGDDMPTQEEVITLLGHLHRADALKTDIPPDIGELSERRDKEKRMRFWGQVRSPLALKVQLFDPERFIQVTFPLVRPFFGWFGLVLWLAAVIWALTLVGPNWRALTLDVADRIFSMENLVLIGLTYPLVKILHEFGHAYFIKKWGGEVHEMGVMFLVLMPIPYVDASASLAFRDKYRRMTVGAAGILVELFFAALAIIAWVHMEAGPTRALVYNIILICGVSSVLFNGNPLLRFDAYYVLSDWLEIPNLGTRGNRYIGYLLQRYLIGVKGEISPAYSTTEALWLGAYALAAFLYRIYISVVIILFVSGKFFIIGTLLAIWAAGNMVFIPIVKIAKIWMNEQRLQQYRSKAIACFIVLVSATVILTGLVPWPAFTITQGIVWAPEQTRVYASTNGFVAQVLIQNGTPVEKGTLLLLCSDPEIDSQVAILSAQIAEFESRLRSSLVRERTELEILRDEIERIQSELSRALEKRSDLEIRSPAKGVFLVQNPEDIPGRFVNRGELLGYVIDPDQVVTRVIVPQENIDLVRNYTTAIEVRLAADIMRTHNAEVLRAVPEASRGLPSRALSLEGGGEIALDPQSQGRLETYKSLFQFELAIPGASAGRIGERVFVRFVHEPEPLVKRWYRTLRRLFLRYFSV